MYEKWSGESGAPLPGAGRKRFFVLIRKLYGRFSYNSRHLAQEDHLKETKTAEELERAKSTIRQAASTYLSFQRENAADRDAPVVLRIGAMCVVSC
jgi:hypothetical protein